MVTSDFDFELPDELIAAYPSLRRGEDRLLILERNSGVVTHSDFPSIVSCFREGDLLVINDTRVRKARLEARKSSGGRVELLLLSSLGERRWECLTKSSRPLIPGTELEIEPGLTATFEQRKGAAAVLRFSRELQEEDFDRLGEMPLPPYILKQREGGCVQKEDEKRYQTVFAVESGAVAAPTAGLHFTPQIFKEAADVGVELCRITLEVGWGTFAPVKSEIFHEHPMHFENYRIGTTAATVLNLAIREKRRIIAVGTTVVRTLEAAKKNGRFEPLTGSTDIFISPGYSFSTVDALVTNFHTPRSTLLMLVSAFAGWENIMNAYRVAVQERYRFYSYGDVMFIH